MRSGRALVVGLAFAVVSAVLVSCSGGEDEARDLSISEDVAEDPSGEVFAPFRICMGDNGVELTWISTDPNGFPQYELSSPDDPVDPEAAMRAVMDCFDPLQIGAEEAGVTTDSLIDYWSDYFLDTGVGSASDQSTGEHRPESVGVATLEQSCSEYGCVDILTKLTNAEDGAIDKGMGISPARFSWSEEELPRSFNELDPAKLSGFEQVAAQSAPSVVQVIGDRCFDEVGLFSSKTIMTTTPYTGFFVSPALVLTHSSAMMDLNQEADESSVDGMAQFGSEETGPSYPESCEAFGRQVGANFTEGEGPFIQTFDGVWGRGRVLEEFSLPGDTEANVDPSSVVLIEIEAYSDDPNIPASQWKPWSELGTQVTPLPVDAVVPDRVGETLTIHHPSKSRPGGGWITTLSAGSNCAHNALSSSGTSVILNHYSDRSSMGAPILDDEGRVVAIVDSSLKSSPDLCPENVVSTERNSLGPLSTFEADGQTLTVGKTLSSVKRQLDALGVDTTSTSTSQDPVLWPTDRHGTIGGQRFEIVEWGEGFTDSGFPESELGSSAIDRAKQATVMFVKQSGCETCQAAARDLDFSVTCLCTGFAVTNDLIVTNDHCVMEMSVGQKATFKTYAGQVVEATLIGKSSEDGETNLNPEYERIYGDIMSTGPDEAATGLHRGDVALFRTGYPMDLDPVTLADSDALQPRQPVISIGHPAVMTRTGPFVTSVGTVIGEDVFDRTSVHYLLPADGGASGSGVFNLDGDVIGQVAYGNSYSASERVTVLPSKYGLYALEIDIDALRLLPSPLALSSRVPINPGLSTSGAPSNYIRELVEQWAPGELP